MNKKKAGLIAGGALAVLVAASPLAWAADGSGDQSCTFTGDNAKESSVISTDNPANAVPQAPVGGNNVGHYAECSDYGHDNGQGNGQGNLLNGQELPGFPDAPDFPDFPSAPAFPSAPQLPSAGN